MLVLLFVMRHYTVLETLHDHENLHIPCLFVYSLSKMLCWKSLWIFRNYATDVLSTGAGRWWTFGETVITWWLVENRRTPFENGVSRGKVEQNESKIAAISERWWRSLVGKFLQHHQLEHGITHYLISRLPSYNAASNWISGFEWPNPMDYTMQFLRRLDDDSPLEWLGNDRMVVEWI